MAEAAPAGEVARPFPGLTGQGISIAVIDSGVHAGHPHIRADRIAPGIMVLADGTVEEGEDAARDRLGHGTAVTAAIQEKAPDAHCIPVRVFRESLKTSGAALLAAIRWSIARKVDIVNLSLGSVNAAHRTAFAAVADEAIAAGIVLVAAREANETPCFPGALPQVIGVGLDWDCPRGTYLARPGVDGFPNFCASGYPRPIAGVPQQRNLYGISFAVAQMSGFAALACAQLGDDFQPAERTARIRQLLAAQATR